MIEDKPDKPEIIIDEAQFLDEDLMELVKEYWHDEETHVTIIKNRAWIRHDRQTEFSKINNSSSGFCGGNAECEA